MISNKLEIKTVKYVLSPCLFDEKENIHGFDVKRCRKCEYFGSPNLCSYDLVTREVSYQTSDSDCYRRFECVRCGHKIIISSSFDVLHRGNREHCNGCGTLHTFIEVRNKKYIFAVPILT